MMKLIRSYKFYSWYRLKEKIIMTIVWLLPPLFVYWAGMRILSTYDTPNNVNMIDALGKWLKEKK